MAIEKSAGDGKPTEQNVKELVKQADAAERTTVLNMTRFLKKEAIVVIATGPRAVQLRKILEASD